MVLESGGSVCRANQAARRIFGFSDDLNGASLSNVWDEKNTTSATEFLQEQNAEATAQVNLRLHGGKQALFFAHVARVAREGHDYFVLQVFKEAGAALPELASLPPPKPAPAAPSVTEKKESPPALMDAGWPVIVIDRQGNIQRANAAAGRLFGTKQASSGSALAGLCPQEEGEAVAKLLKQPLSSPEKPLKVCQMEGGAVPFRVESCSAPEPNCFILQFFKAAPAPPAASAAPVAKLSDDFLLQNAEWPVLLVQRRGHVLRANHAAVLAFGPDVGKGDTQFGVMWSLQNSKSCLQFLASPALEPAPVKLQLKSGLAEEFLAQTCESVDQDVFVLQLFKPATPEVEKPAEPKPAPLSPAPAALAPPEAAANAAKAGTESSLAHKQKLDCALQLARSVALDFNNALTSILGHTSLLLSKAEPNHPWRSSLGEIEKSAAKAAEIANDLAAFSRQEKDLKVQVAGNMNTVLERTIEVFQDAIQGKIIISRHLERRLFTANFDEAKMQQALVKIFENAVESIKGEGKINVQTRNLELTESTQDRTAKLNPGNYVCVEVADTGSGISEEVMPRIFEPFFTTKGSAHRGLGLAWVYGIVTNHGGGVAVSSQPGIGTAVRLYLPANKKIVKDAPAADGDLTGNQTVLLVDDEDLLLTMGQMVLSSYGYTVLTANSGQKALELFNRSPKKKIDLVITDLVMPNMSGRELSEHILRAAPETRIIWSSGYVRSANAQEQERYLQKPFTAQDLLRKVKQVLVQ